MAGRDTRVALITNPVERDAGQLQAKGRALRSVVRRHDQATWDPAPDRDAMAILLHQAESRVPELVAVRHGRMLASPFSFYRGAPAVMAADLAPTPRTGIAVQACGDAHLLNFGLYATPERHLVFDVNDFDETLPAPWEWDLKRLLASFVVAGRVHGAVPAQTDEIVRAGAAAYAGSLATLATLDTLDIWYARLDAELVEQEISSPTFRRDAEHAFAKARMRTNRQALDKLTRIVDGRRVIVDDPPLICHVPELTVDIIDQFVEGYRATLASHHEHLLDQYELVDAARKVVGVGSVGTRCFVVVGQGRGAQLDPLILQVKEAEPSVLEPHVGRSAYPHAGQRVVAGQRLMQAASDVFLGWSSGPEGGHYYVRQLRDMKGSVDVDVMTPDELAEYSKLCAECLARAHARSVPPALLSGYCGRGEQLGAALTGFAHRYADQTERDHDSLVAAVRAGRVAAETGI
jgi:uncharacterized protein (DUF2252 family)